MSNESNSSDDEPTNPGVDPPSSDEALVFDSALSLAFGAEQFRETARLLPLLGPLQRRTALANLVSILDGVASGILTVRDEIKERAERKDTP